MAPSKQFVLPLSTRWPTYLVVAGAAIALGAVAWLATFYSLSVTQGIAAATGAPNVSMATAFHCLVTSAGACGTIKSAAWEAGIWLPYEPLAFWVGLAAFVGGAIAAPLQFSALVDVVNEKIGVICNWLILLACIVSGGNAMVRYAYDQSSNAWLEVQWYMFAVIVMFGAAYTLKRNEHVRVDLLYMTLGRRGQLWIDILGTVFFLLPTCLILAWLSWPFFMQAYNVNEHSSNAGGLLRWPIKIVLPVGFMLVALQGLSEVIKRVAFLNGIPVESLEAHYERPTQ